MITTPNVARLENVTRLLAGINAHDQYFGHGPYGRHNREHTREEINPLLRYAGFEIESLTSANVYPNRAAEFADRRPLVPTLRRREHDLGQYLFVRARGTAPGMAKRPRSLFRSSPRKRRGKELASRGPWITHSPSGVEPRSPAFIPQSERGQVPRSP